MEEKRLCGSDDDDDGRMPRQGRFFGGPTILLRGELRPGSRAVRFFPFLVLPSVAQFERKKISFSEEYNFPTGRWKYQRQRFLTKFN